MVTRWRPNIGQALSLALLCQFAAAQPASKQGCGATFLQEIRKWGVLGAGDVDFSASRDQCWQNTGKVMSVNFDILSFLDSSLKSATKAEASLKRMQQFYSSSMTAQELEEMKGGVFFCVPSSCVEETDLRHVVMVYFSCLATGVCQDADFMKNMPIPGEEDISVALVDSHGGDRAGVCVAGGRPCAEASGGAAEPAAPPAAAPATQAPEPPATPVAPNTNSPAKMLEEGCGRAFMGELSKWVQLSGMAIDQMRYKDANSPSIADKCFDESGVVVSVQFDLFAFMNRVIAMDGKAVDALRRMREFYIGRMTPFEIAEVKNGLGFCVPRQCAPQEDLQRVTLLYFACLATGVCEADGALDNLPLMADELNASVVAKEALEWPDPEQDYMWHSQPIPGESGTLLPWWLGCPQGLGEEWKVWDQVVRESLDVRSAAKLNKTMMRGADYLIETYYDDAQVWATWSLHYTEGICGAEHLHFRHEDEARPMRWQAIEQWKYDAGFCPHLYIAAAYLRCFARAHAGLITSASQDLMRIRMLLGGCAELDEAELKCCARVLWPVPPPLAELQAPEAEEKGPLGTGCETSACRDPLLRFGVRVLQLFPPLY